MRMGVTMKFMRFLFGNSLKKMIEQIEGGRNQKKKKKLYSATGFPCC